MFNDEGPLHIDMDVQKTKCCIMLYVDAEPGCSNPEDYSSLKAFNCHHEMYLYNVIKFQDIENDMMSCSDDEDAAVQPVPLSGDVKV